MVGFWPITPLNFRRFAGVFMTLSADRSPVSTYEQALFWLIGEFVDDLGQFDVGPLPAAARLVCVVFWVTEEQFRVDIRREVAATFGGFRRGRRSVRWAD